MADLITHHALLRYAERVLKVPGLDANRPSEAFVLLHRAGIDSRAIAGQLAAIVSEAAQVGADRLRRDGVTYCFTDGFLTTVLIEDRRPVASKRVINRTVWRKGRRVQGTFIERIVP